MKILLLHSDFIEWEPKKKAIKQAEEIEKKIYKAEEALVVFSSVEKGDEKNTKNLVDKTVKEILDVYDEVKAKTIVIYPYVHLSQKPSKPDVALKVLKNVERILKEKGYEVYRAPFGWYKAFNIKVKGHPLSELSREITPEGEAKKENVSEALKKEKTLKSEWYILTPDGNAHKIEMKDGKIHGFDFKGNERLEKLVKYEITKNRLVTKEPPHIKHEKA